MQNATATGTSGVLTGVLLVFASGRAPWGSDLYRVVQIIVSITSGATGTIIRHVDVSGDQIADWRIAGKVNNS